MGKQELEQLLYFENLSEDADYKKWRIFTMGEAVAEGLIILKRMFIHAFTTLS